MIKEIVNLRNHLGFMKYLKNTSWLFAEKVLRVFTGLFVGIWLSRYLGPNQLGVFSYAQSFVVLLTCMASLGIDSIVIRELVKSKNRNDDLILTSFLIKLFGAIFSIFLLVIGIIFSSNDSFTNTLIIIIGGATIFQVSSVFDLYFQCTSKYHISQAGGGNIINMINKDKLLLIDFWPIGYFLPNSIIYYKKVFFNKKNISYKDIIKDDIEKNIKNKKKLSKYLVYYNDKMLKNDNLRFYSEDEYLDIVKKYLKNSKINKINQSINDIPHLDFIEKKFNFKIIN